MKLAVRADRQLIRAGARSRRFLCAEIQAPEAPGRPGRLPVDLAFVLDRSGSMEGDKIAHARAAVLQGIRSLRDEDRFAVVAYDDRIEVVVPTTPATAEAREAAARAVARIGARAQTDLEGGWRRGCEQVVEHLSSEAVGRCLLLTDGLANAGVTDHDEIVCAHRDDVDIKLQAADFCASCHDALRANGIPMDRVQRLAEVVRTLAVPAGVVH